MSNDSTIGIVKEFANKDPRIRYLSEKDHGIYDAFNKGWKIAKGEWIYYLGSDDVLTEDGIGKLMNEAEIAGMDVGCINGGVLRISQDGYRRKVMSNGYIGSHQGMIMRRTAIEELNGFDLKYKILADYNLFIRMKNSHWSVINTDTIVAYFKAGGTSEKISSTHLVFKEKLMILRSDKYCNFPILITLYDTSRTVLGGIFHRCVSKIKV